MSVGKSERNTQDRVIELFHQELGYRFLGNWTDRSGNSNIEESLLATWLSKSGYSADQVSRAIYLLRTEAADNHNRSLYDNCTTTTKRSTTCCDTACPSKPKRAKLPRPCI